MSKIINDEGLDILFRQARTHNKWTGEGVSEVMIRALYDLMKWGPTSANSCPARFLFVTSPEAKAKLRPLLLDVNQDKMMQAPVCVIIAHDMRFFDKMADKLFPIRPEYAKMFESNPALSDVTAFRNGSLQGAYLMLAARALGLDCGPMSGFDNAGVDAAFFAGTNYKSNFLCLVGHGDPGGVYPRMPRLDFEEACKIL